MDLLALTSICTRPELAILGTLDSVTLLISIQAITPHTLKNVAYQVVTIYYHVKITKTVAGPIASLKLRVSSATIRPEFSRVSRALFIILARP